MYIFIKLGNYLDVNNVSMENMTFCAADGAPVMIGKKNGCLILLRDEKLLSLCQSSYCAECDFSSENDFLLKKRSQMDIIK